MPFKFTLITAAIIIGLILSLFQISHQTIMITDTFLYLKTAVIYQDEGFRAAMESYPWPFYSMLIAKVQQLTGLSMLASGQLVNITFQSWLIFIFISLVACFRQDKTTLLTAAVLILVYSRFNTLRPDILRDFAYWACLFSALWALMRYTDTLKLHYIALWTGFGVTSFLFRLEGFYLVLALPFTFLIYQQWSWKEKFQRTLAVSVLPIMMLIGTVIIALVYPELATGRLSQLGLQVNGNLNGVASLFQNQNAIFSDQLLHPLTAKYSHIALFAGLFVVFIIILCKSITPTFVFLGLYTLGNRQSYLGGDKIRLLFSFIAMNLFIALLYYASRYFIISRYLMAFNLGLLVWISLSLSNLLHKMQKRQAVAMEKCFLSLVAVGLVTMSLHSIDHHFNQGLFLGDNNRYAYIKQAGLWLQHNLPVEATLYANNDTLLYLHAGDKRAWLKEYTPAKTDTREWLLRANKADWLAINITHKQQIPKQLVAQNRKEFVNYRGDRVIIVHP